MQVECGGRNDVTSDGKWPLGSSGSRRHSNTAPIEAGWKTEDLVRLAQVEESLVGFVNTVQNFDVHKCLY